MSVVPSPRDAQLFEPAQVATEMPRHIAIQPNGTILGLCHDEA